MATFLKFILKRVSQAYPPVASFEAVSCFRFKAVCCAVDTGFAVSAVLSTLPRPTIDFVIHPTVPVNVGEFIGAFNARSVSSTIVPLRSWNVYVRAAVFEFVKKLVNVLATFLKLILKSVNHTYPPVASLFTVASLLAIVPIEVRSVSERIFFVAVSTIFHIEKASPFFPVGS